MNIEECIETTDIIINEGLDIINDNIQLILQTWKTAYEKEKEERERIGKLYYEANENCIKYEKMIKKEKEKNKKQQKEIEDLKEKIKTFKIEDENIYLQFGEITEKKKWEDKIKAKIEEIDKVLNNDIYVIDGQYDDRYYRYLQDKQVLQSLLEKE